MLARTVPGLAKPAQFLPLAKEVARHCLGLRSALLKQDADAVDLMDDISNNLCSLMDPLQCIGTLHPERAHREASQEALGHLHPLMHSLNTDQQVFAAIRAFVASSSLAGEKAVVARSILDEFSQFGLDRPNAKQVADIHEAHHRLMLGIASDLATKSRTHSYRALFRLRGALAASLGYGSFAEMSLRNSILKTPAEVRQFLDSYSACEQPAPDLAGLLAPSGAERLQWDSLASVMDGFSRMALDLFGVTIRPAGADLWALSEPGGTRGLVHVDTRPLPVAPSHFTLIGSKGTARGNLVLGRPSQRQIPVMYVSCPVRDPGSLTAPERQSLFHELGHALHGALSATEYQVLSGTRCPLDFAEFPSTLLEKLGSTCAMLRYLGAPPHAQRLHRDQQQGLRQGLKQAQIGLARLDQELHGACQAEPPVDTGRLVHLGSYGANCYAYPLADHLADSCLRAMARDARVPAALRDTVLCRGGTVAPLAALRSCGVGLALLPRGDSS